MSYYLQGPKGNPAEKWPQFKADDFLPAHFVLELGLQSVLLFVKERMKLREKMLVQIRLESLKNFNDQ